jgi:hypothetical protein
MVGDHMGILGVVVFVFALGFGDFVRMRLSYSSGCLISFLQGETA